MSEPGAPESRPLDSPDVGAPGKPSGRWYVPYLVVLGLGVVAALLVLIQLWGYRDEIRAIIASP